MFLNLPSDRLLGRGGEEVEGRTTDRAVEGEPGMDIIFVTRSGYRYTLVLVYNDTLCFLSSIS